MADRRHRPDEGVVREQLREEQERVAADEDDRGPSAASSGEESLEDAR